ncbi:MAG: ATP-binding cassette domain-containing protein [Verrucomicrobiae bacterium]|nr:ATP-binding cassette domain-containing protein [Verrucomicrobiae bacterium]
MNAAPALRVSRLTVQRGRNFLLKDVSWTVRRGERWALLGANGSGKTSLVRCLTGHLAFSRGEVEVLGERFGETDWRDLRRRIGWATSALEHAISEDEPVIETAISGARAMLGLWGRASRSERRRAQTLLRQVGLGRIAERPWGRLSQGERQRTLIARALMPRPALLILDEPCAGLDPLARAHFLAWLERLARNPQAPTLLLVTHHLEEITPSFRHALLLRKGRVLAAGPRDAVLTAPRLGDAYGVRVRVRRIAGRLHLDAPRAFRGVM